MFNSHVTHLRLLHYITRDAEKVTNRSSTVAHRSSGQLPQQSQWSQWDGSGQERNLPPVEPHWHHGPGRGHRGTPLPPLLTSGWRHGEHSHFLLFILSFPLKAFSHSRFKLRSNAWSTRSYFYWQYQWLILELWHTDVPWGNKRYFTVICWWN